jgi:hypothetical protein
MKKSANDYLTVTFYTLKTFCLFDIYAIFAIIYLTRQPTGRCRLPVPANYSNFSKPPIRPRNRAAYLFYKFRIATTSKANVSKICISSYVLISIILLSRLRMDGTHALPAARLSILSRCRLPQGQGSFSLPECIPLYPLADIEADRRSCQLLRLTHISNWQL